jgi:hypothetical protein
MRRVKGKRSFRFEAAGWWGGQLTNFRQRGTKTMLSFITRGLGPSGLDNPILASIILGAKKKKPPHADSKLFFAFIAYESAQNSLLT